MYECLKQVQDFTNEHGNKHKECYTDHLFSNSCIWEMKFDG